jgi:hypothetical protein
MERGRTPFLGKATLRSVESVLEGKGFGREGNIRGEPQDLIIQRLSSVRVTPSSRNEQFSEARSQLVIDRKSLPFVNLDG